MKRIWKINVVVASSLALTGAVRAADIDAAADAPRPAIEKVVVRSNALFDFDRADVRSEDAQHILADLAAAGTVTWQSVNAVGYTDSVGTPQYNQGLSERRASAVKALLVGKGVAPDMIMTVGKGPQEPIASNDDPDGRAQNRRTMIEFQGVRTASQ